MRLHLRAIAAVACVVAGCTGAPPPSPGPPSWGLDPPATYARWLASLPETLKLRHQVETRFYGRTEVVEGYLLTRAPDSFWVRAQTPFGGTLFDVKARGPRDVQYDVRIDEVRDGGGPALLARDIRRIYLTICAAGAPVSRDGDDTVVHCALASGDTGGEAIVVGEHRDEPDDALTLRIGADGLLRQKRFERAGALTAIVDYGEYRPRGERWMAHRIDLRHQQVDYGLTIQLVDAEIDPDIDRFFAPEP